MGRKVRKPVKLPEITLADLQGIVLAAGGPPIEDTFNAQAIVRSVNILIRDRAREPMRPPPELEKCREALGELSKNLPVVLAGYEAAEAQRRVRLKQRAQTAVEDSGIEDLEVKEQSALAQSLVDIVEEPGAERQSHRGWNTKSMIT